MGPPNRTADPDPTITGLRHGPSSPLEVLFNIQLQRNQLDWNAKEAMMRGDTSINYFIDLSSLSFIFQRSRKEPRRRRGPGLLLKFPFTESILMVGDREFGTNKISGSLAPRGSSAISPCLAVGRACSTPLSASFHFSKQLS